MKIPDPVYEMDSIRYYPATQARLEHLLACERALTPTSVTESLPKSDEPVLGWVVYSDGPEWQVCVWDGFNWWVDLDETGRSFHITHWLPLPPAPEVEA